MFHPKPDPEELFRRKLRERFRAELAKARDEHIRNGRFPFEGGWHTLDQILAIGRNLKRKDRQIFLELILLFLILVGGMAFPVVVLVYALLP